MRAMMRQWNYRYGLTRLLIAVSTLFIFATLAFAQSPTNTKKPGPETAPAPSQAGPPRAGTKVLVSGKSVHMSCDRSLRDLARSRIECFGNVYLRRPGELLTADYAVIEMATEELHAEGNVVYFTSENVIYGAKLDFNLATDTGMIEDGRVESNTYELLGEKMERLAPDHYIVKDGEYTTCRDCPASWKIAGRKIDFTINGYAKITHMFIKIKDASALYLPYAIFPVKTERQSGLLFPRMQPVSQNGFVFVQPYFWAISRNMDLTLGAGIYSKRGQKVEGQYRYVINNKSRGELNMFYLRDRAFIRAPYYNRWATEYSHRWVLPWGIEQRMRLLEASDRDYARLIGDIPGRGEPALVSEAGISKATRDASGWIIAKRSRNQLIVGQTNFDDNTVQLLPSLSVASNDHQILKGVPLYAGISGNYSRFWRDAPSFDEILPQGIARTGTAVFTPGETPIRRAHRFMLVPEVYYTFKFWDVLEFIPNVQYRAFNYLFDGAVAGPTSRGYLLGQAETAATIEHVYGQSVKHKFRSSLTYSAIPVINQNSNHPFIQQLKTDGYQFDQLDIVPITQQNQLYFVPIGNSLSYRLGNKFIFKSDTEDGPQYRKAVDVTAGQTFNFIEYRNSGRGLRSLSRFFTLATVETMRLNGRGEYYYYPEQKAPTYSLSLSYIFSKYARRLLRFERSMTFRYDYNQVLVSSHSLGGGLTWSFNDYFAVTGGIDYRFPMTRNSAKAPGIIMSVNGGVGFQSPSQCYKVVLLGNWAYDTRTVAITFNVPINLTGQGFMNLTDSSGGPGLAGPRGAGTAGGPVQ